MVVVLDQKDSAKLDKKFAAQSQVFDILRAGATEITEADFVGVREVRVNKMKGFTATQYKRNQDNGRTKLSIAKETMQITQEDWMAYDFDQLDMSESGALTIENALNEHRRLISVPRKDQYAVQQLIKNAQRTVTDEEAGETMTGKVVSEIITPDNALSAYDDAEQYMTDTEVIGPFVIFASSDYYKALKNAKNVSKTFSVNTMSINGINRKVGQLDDETPILKVGKSRLQVEEGKHINFIMVPLNVAMALVKYSTVDVVGADQDRDAYRSTLKGLDYYDVLLLDNALPAIYVSWTDATPVEG